jgi:hypothetical protein
MHGIVAEQVRVGFRRPQIVNRHDLQILAPRFRDRAQHQTPMRPNPLIATRTAMTQFLF